MRRPHPRPCSGRKTLRRCRNGEEADNVILIDADSENFDNVIIIDIPDSFSKKKRGSGRLGKDKWSWRNVIYIDDDETSDSNHSTDVNNVSFSAGTSSRREPCHATKNFTDSTVEECQFVQDNSTPVRLSKCKRTYSGKTSTRNRYGLNTDSESDSSDGEYPDCELVEDSSGKVHELWEKAFSRRRNVHNGRSGTRVDDKTSCDIGEDHHQNTGMKDVTNKQKEASFCFSREKSNNKNNISSTSRKEDADFGSTIAFDDPTVQNFSQSNGKSDVHGRSNPEAKVTSNYGEQVDLPDCEPGGSNGHFEEIGEHLVSSNSAFSQHSTKEFDHSTPASKGEETPLVETCPPKSESCVDSDPCSGKSSFIEDEDAVRKCRNLCEAEVEPGRSFLGDDHKNLQERDTSNVKEKEHLEFRQPHATGNAKEMENLMPKSHSFERPMQYDIQTDHNSTPSSNVVGSISEESLLSKNSLASGDGIKQSRYEENWQPVSEKPLFVNIHLNQGKHQEDDSLSNSQQEENEDGQLHVQNADTSPSVMTSLINKREKLKETDEYKRALEEELASRQQALAIQAEEAQRLRRLHKRRKAESIRLLDMERRQKQRVEEVRNTQKKDEENLNLKELIRAEVRKELNQLETTCHDMASLLRLLGIDIGGWPNPLPQQVQTAYKRALLTFHPDRALQSDIRRQVEAEEKFKLINRLKEKFPLLV